MRFITPLLSLAVLAAPATIAAQDNATTIPVRISYADIDLSTTDGRAVLETRIDAKLRDACSSKPSARYTYGRTITDKKCVEDARAQAKAAIAQRNARGGRQASAN